MLAALVHLGGGAQEASGLLLHVTWIRRPQDILEQRQGIAAARGNARFRRRRSRRRALSRLAAAPTWGAQAPARSADIRCEVRVVDFPLAEAPLSHPRH